MSKITTKYFPSKIATLFKQDLLANVYYFAASRHSNWTDENAPNTAINTTRAVNEFKREMMFGKRIKSPDVTLLVNRNPWTTNTVYAQYDDTDADLYSKDFFTINSSLNVYKCLFNNGNVASTIEPTLLQSDTFQTNDGYVWKYMYTVSSANNTKFTTQNYIPVDANTTNEAAAANGAIDVILITNQGTNYRAYANGQVAAVISPTLFRVISATEILSTENLYYNDSTFYITSGASEGSIATVVNYIANASGTFVQTDIALASVNITSMFTLMPQIQITGDGTGAKAICTVDKSANVNNISSILVVNNGINYTYADVRILSNPTYGTNAAARAVISPPGGHGSNPAIELGSKHVGISTFFNNTESSTITTRVKFRQVGLITAPDKYTLPAEYLSFNANSSVDATANTIAFTSANTTYKVGDAVRYVVMAGNTALTNLVNNTIYYVVTSNTTTVQLSATLDGTAIDLTKGLTETGHRLYTTNTYSSTTFSGITSVSLTSATLPFIVNETVVGLNSSTIARVAYANTTYMETTVIKGAFANGETIVGNTSSATATISNINTPSIEKFSADVLYINNVEFVTRANTESEQTYLIVTV